MTSPRRLRARLALVAMLALSAPTLAACPEGVSDASCSPSDAKNFSSKEGCNFQTVGAACSKEGRRHRAHTTGAPVVCISKGKGLHWDIDIRPVRGDEWKTAKTPRPTAT